MIVFDKSSLGKVLTKYKSDFLLGHWQDEKYKWEAVKWFQDKWNIDAVDFAGMLELSLKLTDNLMGSNNYYPGRMIIKFAKAAPDEVKEMFANLFDESKDVCIRIEDFKKRSNNMLQKYGNGAANHYQTENAISTYLWLKFPERYYIYKIREIKKAAEVLRSNYAFKRGAYLQNLHNFYLFYDEIHDEIKKDTELVNLLKTNLTDSCYPDNDLRTLTLDIGFYISKKYSKIISKDKPRLFDPNDNLSNKEGSEMNESKARFRKWFAPIVDTLFALGGEGNRQEVHQQIIKRYNIRDDELEVKNKSGYPVIINDIDWARNYLTYEDILDSNASNGIWRLTELGKKIKMTDSLAGKIINKWVRINTAKRKKETEPQIDLSCYYEYRIAEYTKEAFLSEVYMDEAKYDALVSILKHKKNIILQGAPGVGKTFAAKRLAYSIMGHKDNSRIKMVQFHQNYTYEDFVMGYRPCDNGFKLEYGIFYQFCEEARQHKDDYFFIIDEINRGNLSKIFGELLMLIEKDYRDEEIVLSYNGEAFAVPHNLYIIGMMNTADRSLTLVDYALRRRFSFFSMEPGYDTNGFRKYQQSINNEKLNAIIDIVRELNIAISADSTLGKGFCIGHSYFCELTECTDDQLKTIVEYDIIPTLSEYWFDNEAELEKWNNRLLGVF